MIRRQTFQIAFVVLSFTSILFTLSTTRDGGTLHWYLFFSPMALAASFYGVRGALLTGLATFVTLGMLYQNALTLLKSLHLDAAIAAPAQLLHLFGKTPSNLALGGNLSDSMLGTTLMLVGAVGLGYLGDRSRRLERELGYMADHDALTGLYNRRRFTEELDREIGRCRSSSNNSVLLYLDLDGFKLVNDTLGHAVGDQVLAALAGILRTETRVQDVVGRMGGDEFALLLPNLDDESCLHVIRRLLQAVAESPIPAPDAALRVTASIGWVRLNGPQTPSARDLLLQADHAMYRAKRGGKNQALPAEHIAAGALPAT